MKQETEIISQRIKTNNISSISELKKEVNSGGKFVVYKYTFFTIPFFTNPIFYKSNDKRIRKYFLNFISLIFGWIGFRLFGFIQTYKAIKLNNKGGIDVTSDLLLNIKEGDVERQCIKLEKATTLFDIPDKWDLKAFKKALLPLNQDLNYRKIVVAEYINCDDPYFVVGYEHRGNNVKVEEQLNLELGKHFRKFVEFEFVDLSSFELTDVMIQQGEIIIKR